jgi:hypothetical protein
LLGAHRETCQIRGKHYTLSNPAPIARIDFSPSDRPFQNTPFGSPLVKYASLVRSCPSRHKHRTINMNNRRVSPSSIGDSIGPEHSGDAGSKGWKSGHWSAMTATEWAAWVGACGALGNLCWNMFTKWTFGPKLKVTAVENTAKEGDRTLTLTVQNVGTRPTTVSGIKFQVYPSRGEPTTWPLAVSLSLVLD